MKFTTAVASALLLAGSVAAAPFTERRRAANAERLARRFASGLPKAIGPLAVNATSMEDTIMIGPKTEAAEANSQSSNWSGAVQISSGITVVQGTVNFPSVSIPPGGSSRTQYGGSAWVGIDGDTCQNTILQTGIDWTIQGSSTHYEAWFEWLPAYSTSFSITVNPGDQITMKVVATSKTAGTAYITNQSTGKSVSHSFSGQTALCEQNAEWIVEDFTSGSSLIPFAQYSKMTFTGASYTHGGTTSGVSGSTLIDMVQNGQTLSTCSLSGSSSVICNYQ